MIKLGSFDLTLETYITNYGNFRINPSLHLRQVNPYIFSILKYINSQNVYCLWHIEPDLINPNAIKIVVDEYCYC